MRTILLSVLVVVAIAQPLSAACRYEQVYAPCEVCTEWWDGTTSCHMQFGWFETYVCDVYPTGGVGGGGGGGSLPPDSTPPTLSITEISDANPGQPILHIVENSAVVETTVAYDGYVFATTGKTDALFLPSLYSIHGDTVVTVQARNAANVYAVATCHINRDLTGPFVGSTTVLASWTFLQLDRDPAPFHGQWQRTVHLAVTKTSYDIPTFDRRNGEYQHNLVEDQLAGNSADTPVPAWDTKYTIDNLLLNNRFFGWHCDIWPMAYTPYSVSTVCTEPDEFTVAGSPSGMATIRALDVPYSYVTTILSGQSVTVSP